MTPSSDSTHSLVSSGSMSGSWLGRPSLITGRLRSVATGIPLGSCRAGRPLCGSHGVGSILPPCGVYRHAYRPGARRLTHILSSNYRLTVQETEADLAGGI